MTSKKHGAKPGQVTPIASALSLQTTAPERIAALHAIRDRYLGDSSSQQCARLLEAMQSLGHCTTFEASRYLDMYYPPARKLNLLQQGHAIQTTWRTVQTESGATHRVGVYSLKRGQE
ncbi:helix-turn-helix domain-containing protein [Roseateles oligotrophus]|uniref:Helix-turn-helix domain-containing protein n=1 Tax=Roseateles oligotrophus TaxID=1769250 RepID=A0ABT2YB70_9BURK|nr:helix-turn-helix domain-containing protein [Roseateles oligotrophus]MCV2367320.1 helix-turn-helix domain-containing protein [Roseateles oligotrophus]